MFFFGLTILSAFFVKNLSLSITRPDLTYAKHLITALYHCPIIDSREHMRKERKAIHSQVTLKLRGGTSIISFILDTAWPYIYTVISQTIERYNTYPVFMKIVILSVISIMQVVQLGCIKSPGIT